MRTENKIGESSATLLSPQWEAGLASDLRGCFSSYYGEFLDITRRAKSRFEKREWRGVLSDAEARIDLYHHHLSLIEGRLRKVLGTSVHDYDLWNRLKREYCEPWTDDYHADLALIFFYSVMRRLFVETGDSIEYSDDEIRRSSRAQVDWERHQPVRIYPADSPEAITPQLIQGIVEDFQFDAPYLHLEEDAGLVAQRLRPEVAQALGPARIDGIDRIEVLKHAFFRNKAAYLMGRIVAGTVTVPLVLVLLNTREGIVIDSVLSDEVDLSNVFTSARSNFHAEPAAYREVFDFLESIAPTRPKAYIYSSIGFIHPGKLQLVKELRTHMASTGERFAVAEGVPGTVMIVFALPTFRYVFKVIRDVSAKETFRGRGHVVQQYWRVHRTDRVGRMLDIMTFHNLRFRRSDFDNGLLDELLRDAPTSVRTEDDHVIFRYVYGARQIAPLDVYLANPDIPESVKARVVIDYGHAIKDLAAAGIFVGDYMPKNFGVNRLGRVILYDYDDLDDLVRWSFRKLPEPPPWAEMLPYEDWLSRGDFDVFPEHDFRIFTVPAHGREVFLKYHSDVLDTEFWNATKGELESGRVPDFCAYPETKRLPMRPGRVDGIDSRHVQTHDPPISPSIPS